jgi:MoxR-like ATPase
MATAAAAPPIDMTAIPRGQVTDDLVKKHGEIFDPKNGFLAQYNVEREDQIELLGLTMVTGIDCLLLGDPGVGKTWLIELMLQCITGTSRGDLFNTMVFKETTADDILGPRDPMAMKKGEINRLLDGFLPTAVLAYLDEIFKCSPTLANSMLDIMAQRKLKVGKNLIDVGQLLAIFGSSNELPEREDLWPFRDRWGATQVVPPVRAPENRKRVYRIQDEFQANARTVDMTGAPKLTLDEIRQMRAEVARIEIPDVVNETLDTAYERWSGAGHPPSPRRMGQIILAIKGHAWSKGRGQATTDDILVGKDMAWNLLDHADSARNIVMEFANEFTRKANRMREALEPILTKLSEVRGTISGKPTDEQLEDMFKVMRDLRRSKREAQDQIEEGERQGHDVSEVRAVLDTINEAHSYIEKTMAEDD